MRHNGAVRQPFIPLLAVALLGGALLWACAATAGHGQQAAVAPPTALVLGPGSTAVQPAGTAVFAFPRGPAYLPSPLDATNLGAQPAQLADDGETLTISVAGDYVVIANLICAPVGGQANVVSCFHGHTVPPAPDRILFTEAPRAQAAALPQTATLSTGQVASLLAPDGSALAVQVVGLWGSSGEQIQASWDGSSLRLTPASGVRVVEAAPTQTPAGAGGAAPMVVRGTNCVPAPDDTTGLVCPLDGRPPQLVTVTLAPTSPNDLLLPHFQPTPYLDLTVTTSPAAGPRGLPVGVPVTFSVPPPPATGDGASAVVWDFGDGTGGSGFSVTHTYRGAGEYVLRLYATDRDGEVEYMQPPPQPVRVDTVRGQVDYPAGWNLVGGPAGTVLSGARSPLYTLQPCAATADSASAACNGYSTTPADTPLSDGGGYWAFFPVATTITLAAPDTEQATTTLPASGLALIGNPSEDVVTVAGADALWVYDPVAGRYEQALTLQPGEAGVVMGAPGTQVTVYTPFGLGPGAAGGFPLPPPPSATPPPN